MPITSPTDIANCKLYLDATTGVFSDAGTTSAVVGDAVQQWNDQSGLANNATQATSASRPVYVKIAGVGALRFDGSNDFMDTPSMMGSNYNTSISSFVVYEAAKNSIQVAFGNVGAANGFYHAQNAASQQTKTTLALTIGTMEAFHGRISQRIEVFRYNGSSKSLRVAGPDNDVLTSAADTGNMNLSGAMRVGAYGSGGFNYKGLVRAVGIYNGYLSDAEVDDLVTWAKAKFMTTGQGTYASGIGDAVVICDGNSLTSGTYPSKLDTLLGAGWGITNLGVPSQTIGDMNFDADTQIDGLWSAAASRNIVIFWEGINDLGNADAASCFQRHKEYGLRRQHKGFERLVATCIRWNNSAGQETARQEFNTLLRANWADFADGLVDLDADPAFSDINNTTYYIADKVHLTNAGYTVVADIAKRAIDDLPIIAFNGPGFLSSPFRF